METTIGPGMIVGLLLFFPGGIYCIIAFARGSRLAMGIVGLQNFRANLRSTPGARRRFGLAVSAVAVGGFIACGSVMTGDAKRNAACSDACEAAGLEPGRYRANPHRKFEPGDPYECWCRKGDDWATEPVSFTQGN